MDAPPADWPTQPWAEAFVALDQGLRGDGVDAATLSHRLAVIVDGLGALVAGEPLHRRAVLLLALHPAPNMDHHRVEWACALSSNLMAQLRLDDAEAVLLAALALAETLLGSHDPQTAMTRSQLRDLWGE